MRTGKRSRLTDRIFNHSFRNWMTEIVRDHRLMHKSSKVFSIKAEFQVTK
jgi:hypothetical protein